MGPEYWKPGSPTALKKCSERVSNSCEDETDGCCAVIPCAFCLEWDPGEEGGATQWGYADFATTEWSGEIAGATWVAYWERNYDTDECEFVVELDGEEIYRKSCYEGASCRDPSDSASATIDYESGTLAWEKFLSRPMEYVVDEETKCTRHFCDECECTCECLCVAITEPEEDPTFGEICDIAYECDPPLWEGTVSGYELSVALVRDDYGRCVLLATVDGVEQPPVLAPGCGDMEATITLDDGTTVVLTCKKCACTQTEGCPCCPGWPLEKSAQIHFTSTEQALSDCVPIIQIWEFSDIFDCTGNEFYPIYDATNLAVFVRVTCDTDTGVWKVEYKSYATGMVGNDPGTGSWVEVVYDFTCPDCADAVDGVATGTFDFIAVNGCETSGGLVTFNVLVHADVEVQC